MGTTLEILAPYLPYGIEMFGPFLKSEHPGEARKLVGLIADADGDVFDTDNSDGYREVSFCSFFLPVLRSFADLCTPLEDGTVPAVEVAKMLLAQVIDPLDWNNAIPNEDEDRIEVQVPVAGRYPWLIHIQPDYTITCYNSAGIEKEVTAWKAIDYLRRHHFAVGLTEEQYIRKER